MNDILGLNRIRISVALQHAQNPFVARELSKSFGGKGLEMTRQEVVNDFGEYAAVHWQQIIDAQSAFHAAATSYLKETPCA
tara:strand:- start:235 stop:477 length:243 start_codon:yes stop_codon:yes gene_type:complete